MNLRCSEEFTREMRSSDSYEESRRRVMACALGEKINRLFPPTIRTRPEGPYYLEQSVHVYSDEAIKSIRATLGAIINAAPNNEHVKKLVVSADKFLTSSIPH